MVMAIVLDPRGGEPGSLPQRWRTGIATPEVENRGRTAENRKCRLSSDHL